MNSHMVRSLEALWHQVRKAIAKGLYLHDHVGSLVSRSRVNDDFAVV